jgi:hypothetical protein
MKLELQGKGDHFVDLCGDGKVIRWDVDRIQLARYRNSWLALVKMVMTFLVPKGQEISLHVS